MWIVDVRLQSQHALGLQQLDDQIHQRQQVAIIVLAPVRSCNHPLTVGERTLDDVHLVGDQERTRGGPTDHHQLERQCLEDDAELAAGEHVAAERQSDHQQTSDNREHPLPRLTRSRSGLATAR